MVVVRTQRLVQYEGDAWLREEQGQEMVQYAGAARLPYLAFCKIHITELTHLFYSTYWWTKPVLRRLISFDVQIKCTFLTLKL